MICIPERTGFGTDSIGDGEYEVIIERCAHSDRFWERGCAAEVTGLFKCYTWAGRYTMLFA